MSDAIRLRLDRDLYDEDAVRQTVEEFRAVARITTRRSGARLLVTLTTESGDPDRVAGELLNIALARTLEARASAAP